MLLWLRQYRRELLAGDISAGILVALMMIPQGMAYALVAGLPPVVGIYASILPPVLYALFGSSMTQSVGPMAIVSLMTAAALAPLAAAGSTLYLILAAQLALITGAVLVLCGLLRLGFLANFLSRPVMSGFTIGAALLIAQGQVKTLLGGFPDFHLASAALGVGCVLALLLGKRYFGPLLRQLGVKAALADMVARTLPIIVVLVATLLVSALQLDSVGVKTIGLVPSGLPGLNLATSSSHWRALVSPALLIAFVVFVTSMSSAQAHALQRREKLVTNYELLGLGAANLASAAAGAFPVTGSISRSAVNYSAGANTPLASLVTAGLLAVALVAPTGWLALLPLPALAAMIIVAVLGMIELSTLRKAWRYDRSDALALLATAAGVLLLGVEAGVVVGVVLSVGAMTWRASHPHIAVLGRIPGSEHFRNVDRYTAETVDDTLILRVDAGLFYGNADAVVGRIEEELNGRPAVKHLVLVLSAVNQIDTTALFALTDLNLTLKGRGIGLHLAEVKGPVMDRLKNSELIGQLSGQVFLSTARAWDHLAQMREHDFQV